MKRLIFLLALMLALTKLFGQTQTIIFYNPENMYYSKTNFNIIDTTSQWFYALVLKDQDKNAKEERIGQLIFERLRPIDDTLSNEVYGISWKPHIDFDIFNISDSSYCFKKTTHIRMLSSCIPPDVGGDIIIVGKYIFFNSSSCLSCRRPDTHIDYCRPIINNFFKNLDSRKISTLTDLVKQFPIKGQIMNLPF